MDYLDGYVPTEELPPGLEDEPARRRLGNDLVDVLVEIHAADVTTPGLVASPGRGATTSAKSGGSPSCGTSTRVRSRRSRRSAPGSGAICPDVLADSGSRRLRLGNTMVTLDEPSRIKAVLDWEMGAIGDPRADVSYLLAPTASRAGRRTRSGRRRWRPSPASCPRGGSSNATWRAAVAASRTFTGSSDRPLEGNRLLRGDLRPLRSGAESAPRTNARRASKRACPTSPRPPQRRSRGPERPAISEEDLGDRAQRLRLLRRDEGDVAPDSRQTSIRSAIRSFGPTRATSSMNASGTAAAASRLLPAR